MWVVMQSSSRSTISSIYNVTNEYIQQIPLCSETNVSEEYHCVLVCRVPPVLVSSGLRDTRVEWWAPVKFAWRLREHQQGPGDVWLLWDGGGHFYDDPNQIAIEKTFLLEQLVDCTKSSDVAMPRSIHSSVATSAPVQPVAPAA